MKWTALAVALVVHGTAAQQPPPPPNVPAPVLQAWQSRFPAVKTVEWKVKTDKNYEAEFKWRGADVAVKFAPSGTWLETETTIGAITMPEAVRVTIMKTFKGYSIIETQRLDRAQAPQLLYELHLDNRKEVLKVQLDPTGAVTSRSAKPKVAAKPSH